MLGKGRPVPIGLVAAVELKRIGRNHQVLAYGADVVADRVALRIYDPNYPKRDDVVLGIPLSADEDIVERVGTKRIVWRGAFMEHYKPSRRATETDVGGAITESTRLDTPAILILGVTGLLLLMGVSRALTRRRPVVRR